MRERWRLIGINHKYQISNFGRIRRTEDRRILDPKPRLSDGYISVALLMSNGHQKRFYVHRLVAMAFCGGIPIGMQINHLNFCKYDNRACNLEVVTRQQNAAHSRLAGRYANNGKNSPIGERSPHSKLTLKNVLAIRNLSICGIQNIVLARKFNVTQNQIGNIISRKSWAHA